MHVSKVPVYASTGMLHAWVGQIVTFFTYRTVRGTGYGFNSTHARMGRAALKGSTGCVINMAISEIEGKYQLFCGAPPPSPLFAMKSLLLSVLSSPRSGTFRSV